MSQSHNPVEGGQMRSPSQGARNILSPHDQVNGLKHDQVKDHIASIENRLSDDREKKLRGYEFAKLSYQVKDYDCAIGYLKRYLKVKPEDFRAHLWMAKSYEAVKKYLHAVYHYKRCVHLRSNDKDIILKVAELYNILQTPRLGSMKRYLAYIERIPGSDQAIFLLTRKICKLEGKPMDLMTKEKFLKVQLMKRVEDPLPYIDLVQQYTRQGKITHAYWFCMEVSGKGKLTNSMDWLDCYTDTLEMFFNYIRKGSIFPLVIQDGLVSLLWHRVLQFQSILKSLRNSIVSPTIKKKLLDIILKLDKGLFEAYNLSNPVKDDERIFMMLSELCGQLYLMIAQYFYLHTANNVTGLLPSEMVQLGDVCLMRSLRIAPISWDFAFSSYPKMWYRITCARQCIVGWQLLLISSYREKDYFRNILLKGDVFILIRNLLQTISGTLPDSFKLFESHKSFLVTDNRCLREYSQPILEELSIGQEFLHRNVFDICSLVWLYLVQKALGQVPNISDWISLLFPNLPISTGDLTQAHSSSLSRCDLEAFLILQCHECESNMTLSGLKRSRTLHEALLASPPFCLQVVASGSDTWKELVNAATEKFELNQNLSMKIQACLSLIRGCGSLQLSVNQLLMLARHFTTTSFCQWSHHFWSALIKCMGSSTIGKDDDEVACIYKEAHLALGDAALSNNDCKSAKHYFSGGYVPQAAQNQSQLYFLLADWISTNEITYSSYLEGAKRIISSTSLQPEATNMTIYGKKLPAEEKIQQSVICDQASEYYSLEEDPNASVQLTSTPTTSSSMQPLEHGSLTRLTEVLTERTEQIGIISKELLQLKVNVEEVRKSDYDKHVITSSKNTSLDYIDKEVLFEQTCTLHPDSSTEKRKVKVYVLLEYSNQKAKLVMRQEKPLSTCFCHYITSDMRISGGSSKVYLKGQPFYTTATNNLSRKNVFAIQFESSSIAQQFKIVFVNSVKKASPLSLNTKVVHKTGDFSVRLNNFTLWECSTCYSFNKSCDNHCIDCSAANPRLGRDKRGIDLSTDQTLLPIHEKGSLSTKQVTCSEKAKDNASCHSIPSEISPLSLAAKGDAESQIATSSIASDNEEVGSNHSDTECNCKQVLADTHSEDGSIVNVNDVRKRTLDVCLSDQSLGQEDATLKASVDDPVTYESACVSSTASSVSAPKLGGTSEPISSGKIGELKRGSKTFPDLGNNITLAGSNNDNSGSPEKRQNSQRLLSSPLSLIVSDTIVSQQNIAVKPPPTSAEKQVLEKKDVCDCPVEKISESVVHSTQTYSKSNNDQKEDVTLKPNTGDCNVNVSLSEKHDAESPSSTRINASSLGQPCKTSAKTEAAPDSDACVDSPQRDYVKETTIHQPERSSTPSCSVESDSNRKVSKSEMQLVSSTRQAESDHKSTDNKVSKSEVQLLSSPIQAESDRKSTDDDRTILFEQKCKLFQFSQPTKQWNEHGRGKIQIFLQNSNQKHGIIMKDSKTSKLCCYHYFAKDMNIMVQDNVKTLVWQSTSDFSGEPGDKKFTVKFNTADQATKFKEIFQKFV